MIKVFFRFHADLNDFLPSKFSRRRISLSLNNHPAVKDAIESLGVPHTEVDAILVNGVSVDFTYQLRSGDHVEVYPFSKTPDSNSIIHLQPPLTRRPRFVLDTHLGKLAAYLRMLGFDTLYRNDFSDEDMAQISSRQDRYLLTRDRGLLKRSIVNRGYHLRSTNSRDQLIEIIKRFRLSDLIRPFQRCMKCNGVLSRVNKEDIRDRLEPQSREYYDDFFVCDQCGKIYWQGSHHHRMKKFIEQILHRIAT